MFRIRKEQMQAFEQANLPNVEDYMVDHLAGFASRHCELLGEPGVHDVVRLGIKNADSYGLTKLGAVRLYIELMFILGSRFDTDPQLSWASKTLTDPDIADQASRADRLYKESLDYHKRAIGLNSEYAVDALRGIHREAPAIYSISGSGFTDQILASMHSIYPEKYANTGKEALRSLVPRARELAESISATTERSVALFTTSMFAFGHSFHDDPLYPWISGTLNNTKAIKDPDARVDRLYEKTRTYVAHMLDYLQQS